MVGCWPQTSGRIRGCLKTASPPPANTAFVTRAIRKIRHYHSALGVSGVLTFLFAKLSRTKPVFWKRLAGIKYPVCVRIGTTDVSVLKQTLIERHYDYSLPKPPKIIIDAGANIGLSAVFFANKYPDAVIAAIEPERSNFEILKTNASAYSQIRAFEAALWWENGNIPLMDPDHGHHGFRTIANMEGSQNSRVVKALTVDTVMAELGSEYIDVLKIDIEGAEKVVFEHSAGWIDRVGVILAELHDEIQFGCVAAFSEATKDFHVGANQGETVIRISKRLRAESLPSQGKRRI